MAAFKQVVQPECGGQNALLQLTNTFTTDRGMKETLGHQKLADIVHHGNQQSVDQQMVSEFLGAQQSVSTFHMPHLLEEIQHVHEDQRWADEFSKEHEILGVEQPGVLQTDTHVPEQWAEEFVVKSREQSLDTGAQWADEFVSVHSSSKDVQAAAQGLVDSVQDPKVKETQDGEILEHEPASLAEEWVGEFQQEQGVSDVWGQFQKIWEQQFGNDNDVWAHEFVDSKKDYTFVDQNPHEGIEKAFEKGLDKLREGDLPTAILLFEAAVKANPNHAEAWQFLGTSQADNEMEIMAIAALEKCLELEPENLTAMMGLAVSYTNELRTSEASEMLRRWIVSNPQYSKLASHLSQPQQKSPSIFQSIAEQKAYTDLAEVYIAAAQSSPTQVDPQVQVGLGILFNLTKEYHKAVDCFTAALQANPQDAMLWNKLGATLANDNQSEKAVHAYHKALELRPDFVRARYNLGISCINLKAYRESVEHFLSALHFQRSASTNGTTMQGSMSDSIWSSLRLSLMYMGATDLLGPTNEKNLDSLMKHFNIEPK
jgi:peroxin-5